MVESSSVVLGLIILCCVAFFYLMLSPKLGGKSLKHSVPIMRRRSLILDEKIGSLAEVVDITQIGSDKYLFHLYDGANHYYYPYYVWELQPINNVQACAGNTAPCWKVIRDKNEDGVNYKMAYEELQAQKDSIEQEKTLLQQDRADEVDTQIDRLVSLEKSKATTTPRKET